MSTAKAHQLLRHEFVEWWELNYPQIPLAGENDGFQPPDNAIWAKNTLLSGNPRLIGLGGDPSSRLWRVVGVMILQIFTPLDEGVSKVEEIHTNMQKEFQGRTVQNVILREIALTPVGNFGAHVQHNVRTSYQFDYYG